MENKKDVFDTGNWINEKEISRCEGTGISRWIQFGDKSYNIIISKYSDSCLDLKVKITDFVRNRESATWLNVHEAQLLMKALNMFFRNVKE